MEIIQPDLEKAVKAIKAGKVLICPTDTVYGLICDAGNKEALERLYKIKNRPKNKPIPLFIGDIKMAKEIAEISREQEKFLSKVWPGAVTVVLKKKDGSGTIGLRIPNRKLLLGLAKQTGPLAETSANISGRPASTKFNEVLAQFKGNKEQPDLAIDGGDLPPSKASKVIDLTASPFKVLRP